LVFPLGGQACSSQKRERGKIQVGICVCAFLILPCFSLLVVAAASALP
jgi:hypothetical protein